MAKTTDPTQDAPQMTDHWWWRSGWGVGTRFYTWHITLEDQPALRQLVSEYREALRDGSTLDPVPEQWLHITTQGLGHVRDVSDTDRDAIIEAVQVHLASLTASELTFVRPVLHREAVVIPPTNPAPAQAVRDAIRSGISDVWGPDRVPESADGFFPHVTVAYSNGDASPAPIRGALDRVRPAAAAFTLRKASLIILNRDHRMYEWTTAATAAIGHSTTDQPRSSRH